MEGTFRLRRQSSKWALFAEVTVDAVPSSKQEIVLGPDVFLVWRRWAYGPDAKRGGPDDDASCAAAQDGVQYALEHLPAAFGKIRVRIVAIHDSPVDTTPLAVKFAAAYAVWQALGHAPEAGPYIDHEGRAIFPASRERDSGPSAAL
jgi:hypothetical protein